jgi:hypothetical protein
MNKNLEKLAEQAGFIFWTEEEDWGPGPGNIDWSADYAVELEKFAELIIQECARCVTQPTIQAAGQSEIAIQALQDILANDMKSYFGIAND